MQAGSQNWRFTPTPDDTISDIAVCLAEPLVCCSSWNNTVMIYQLSTQNGPNCPCPKHLVTIKNTKDHDAIIRCTFKDKEVIYGTAMGQIYLASQPTSSKVIGKHAGIISGLKWCPSVNLLLSGSAYDNNLNLWDTRTDKPAQTIDLKAKCVALDVAGNSAFIATSNSISQLDLKAKVLQKVETKLQCPITCIACSPDGKGYVAGGAYGIIEANLANTGGTLLPCHRTQKGNTLEAYQSNCVAVSYSGNKSVIISGGGDGNCIYFNASTFAQTSDRKISSKGNAVTAIATIPQQKYYITATGYDWSKGAEVYNDGAQLVEMTIQNLSPKEQG